MAIYEASSESTPVQFWLRLIKRKYCKSKIVIYFALPQHSLSVEQVSIFSWSIRVRNKSPNGESCDNVRFYGDWRSSRIDSLESATGDYLY